MHCELFIYNRQTQQSAQSFTPCVSGEFDIWNPWSKTRASLSTRTMFTVGGATSSTFLSSNLCYPRCILPTHEIYHKLLITDVVNMPRNNVRADSRFQMAVGISRRTQTWQSEMRWNWPIFLSVKEMTRPSMWWSFACGTRRRNMTLSHFLHVDCNHEQAE